MKKDLVNSQEFDLDNAYFALDKEKNGYLTPEHL